MEQRLDEINRHLEDISAFIPKLIDASTDVAELIVNELSDQVWRHVGDVIEGIDDLYRALTGIHEDLRALGFTLVLQSQIELIIAGIQDKFEEMNDYMDNEDYISASDCIYYELIPIFKQLLIALGQGQQQLDNRFLENMSYFQENHSVIYSQIKSARRNYKEYQVSNSKMGTPNLYMNLQGQNSSYLYSRYNPEQEVRRWVNNLKVNGVGSTTSTFFYGFGFGYHIEQYANLYPQNRLYVYEPDVQIFLAAMEIIDFKKMYEKYRIAKFIVGAGREQREDLFYHFARYSKGEPEFYALPLYDRISKEDMDQFYRESALSIAKFNSSIKMTEKFSVEWVRNSLFNLGTTLITPSLAGLKNKFSSKTAIVIGAGPSLEADIESLRRLKQHAILIAAGSAIQSLLHFGIKPHLIVSIDGGEPNYNVFKNINIEEIPLIFAPMIHYQILDKKRDRLVHLYLDNDCTMDHFLSLSPEDPRFLSTYSVTGTAIQAAIYMGCKQIVFAGQDLSYPDNRMYAAGAQHISESRIHSVINNAEMVVENVRGGKNRISPGMEQTLANIEGLIEKYPDIQFRNTSSKGAIIKNAAYSSMNVVEELLRQEKVDLNVINNEIAQLQSYNQSRVSDIVMRMQKLPEEMEQFEERLVKIKMLVNQLPELSRTNPQRSVKVFQNIDSEWKTLLNSDPFQGLYLKICRNELLEFERDLPEFSGETDLIKKADLAISTMNPLIQKMIEITPKLKIIVNETLHRLKIDSK